MKKVVIINGSPRKKGNSSLLATALKEGISDSPLGQVRVDIYSPATHAFAPCIGCERCCKTGECIQSDDMTHLVDALEVADMLIWVSPLYFGGVPSQMKAIIDRFQLLWARNIAAGELKGIRSNRFRPALAFYISAKDDPFATKTKRTAALLPLKYASNTAGFTLEDDKKHRRAIVGPSKPGDIAFAPHSASLGDLVHLALERIWDI